MTRFFLNYVMAITFTEPCQYIQRQLAEIIFIAFYLDCSRVEAMICGVKILAQDGLKVHAF